MRRKLPSTKKAVSFRLEKETIRRLEVMAEVRKCPIVKIVEMGIAHEWKTDLKYGALPRAENYCREGERE